MISKKGKARLLRNFLRNARALPETAGTQPTADDLFSEINPVYLKKPGLSPRLVGMGHTGFFMGFAFTVYLLPITIASVLDPVLYTEPVAAFLILFLLLPIVGFFSYWWLKSLIFSRAPAPTYFVRPEQLVFSRRRYAVSRAVA